MKLASMVFSLSRPAREAAEATLLTEALARFQEKARAVAKALGFPGYMLGQIAVRSEGPTRPPIPVRGRRDGSDGRRCVGAAGADGGRQEFGHGLRVRLGRPGARQMRSPAATPIVGGCPVLPCPVPRSIRARRQGGRLMRRHRNAKIVATLGPASSTPVVIDALFRAGVDVFRLNFSHGTPADHRKRMEAIRAVEKPRRVGRSAC